MWKFDDFIEIQDTYEIPTEVLLLRLYFESREHFFSDSLSAPLVIDHCD